MILSGLEIKKRLGSDIKITPFNEEQLGPNSYNLKLHNKLLVYEGNILDMKKENSTRELIIPEGGLLLIPGKLYLGRTVEYTETDNLVPMLEGRSSIGRLGIFVHITAGFGDVGHCNYWTLEISCIHPVKIYSDVEICQIYYHTVCGDTSMKYNGKYQETGTIQASELYKDFEERKII